MSCLCIGGVCIPYSALFPLLLIGLQWIAAQFAKVGLLPSSLAKKLGLSVASTTEVETEKTNGYCHSGKCGAKSASRCDSVSVSTTATADTSDSTESDDEKKVDKASIVVEHIDSLERWNQVFSSHQKQSTLVIKFTAEWCKPCKAIQPCYVSLASQYAVAANSDSGYQKRSFFTLDIDGDDCDALSSKLRVVMMPTFVCFRNGVEIGRMSGGDNEEKLRQWVRELCS